MDLARDGVEGRLRAFLIHSVINGGLLGTGKDYRERLERMFDETDYGLRHDVDDYEAALKASG